MSLTLVTPPAVEPVSADRVKAVLRIGHDADEDRILQCIAVARQSVEAETGRALITQTWRETRDQWAGPRLGAFGTQFRLLKPPLIHVLSISVFDADDVEIVWEAEQYRVDADSDPGRILLRSGADFPTPGRARAGLAILYEAGHGASPDAVPDDLKEAVAWRAAWLFDGLEAHGEKADRLLAPWRRRGV